MQVDSSRLSPPLNPLVILGWDAATWDLLTPWVEMGELPNLARLMSAGAHGQLRSTPLPLSPAAWTTIITGQNPGRHGVFDWFERRPGSYAVDYVHTGRIAARPIWEYINAAGKRIGILNLPMIYPAVPVHGFMISGMAAPSPRAGGFAFPPDLLAELEATIGPYYSAEAEIYQYGREAAYLKDLFHWLEYQGQLTRYLVQNQPCDVYLLVYMQSDHVQHKFWRYLDRQYPGYNPSHDDPYRDEILRVYRSLDAQLGELMGFFGASATIVLLSDHGAGPTYGIMPVNRWLRAEGYLHLRRRPLTVLKYWLAKTNLISKLYKAGAAAGLARFAQLLPKSARNRVLSSFLSFDDVDWTRTRAYARGAFGQIYVNTKGREPAGSVEPGEPAERLAAEILTKLAQLRHPETGELLITDLHRRAEVLEGPFLPLAADILFSIQHYSYQTAVKLGVESAGLLETSEYEDSGSHRPEGILAMAGPGIKPGARITGATVADVLPTLLALAEIAVPAGLDGEPLITAFSEEKAGRVQTSIANESQTGSQQAAPALDAEELAQLEERLRSLGYLG